MPCHLIFVFLTDLVVTVIIHLFMEKSVSSIIYGTISEFLGSFREKLIWRITVSSSLEQLKSVPRPKLLLPV